MVYVAALRDSLKKGMASIDIKDKNLLLAGLVERGSL